MNTTHTPTNVKRQYVSRNLYERTAASRKILLARCRSQETRLANLNQQVIDLKELAAATAALNFYPQQEPAAVRRYNAARRRVKA